jgi:hypothetical protein
VLAATAYSKAVLRVAAEQIVSGTDEVFYFPAYEIVTGPQAPKNCFKADVRSVSSEAIKTVMSAFVDKCEVGSSEASQRPCHNAHSAHPSSIHTSRRRRRISRS